MHGVVLTSVLSFLKERYSDAPGVVPDASYLPTEMYPDDELDRLLGHAGQATGDSRDTLEHEFGRYAAQYAFRRLYPDFYAVSGGTRRFLLDVEERIHALVRASLPYATPPKLHAVPFGEAGVAITYTSERHLCRMAEGLVSGVADHYGERVTIEHDQCMRRGDLACALFVTIEPASAG